jgi:hypothetical protein
VAVSPFPDMTVSSARRGLFLGVVTAVAVGLMTGIPTDVVPNPWFMRMTPTPWWALPVWAATAVLSGVWVTVSLRGDRVCVTRTDGAAGGVGATAAWLAVGCPICNKIVVGILGVSGALTWFAPIQPWLAVAAPLLLLVAIILQLRRGRPAVGRYGSGQAGIPAPVSSD